MGKYIENSMQEFLKNIPDKRVDKNTTSLKFKEDLITFFKGKNLNICLEVGTSKGWSTRVLSILFSEVYTIENSIPNIAEAKEHNKDRTNIEYLNIDATKEWNLPLEKIDIVFIDCIHTRSAVLRDINQSLKYKPAYLVFDDYGLFPEVKSAILEFIDNNSKLNIKTKYIGEPEGNQPRIGKKLKDWEGIILEL